jgi:UPF0271 protein
MASAGLTVDLNADLGEGFGVWTLGDDTALLDVITSANVACGFHAGDPMIMQRVCAEAVARDVRIGAQVGYHDLAGFGRRSMDIASAELQADILYQIGALDAFARVAGDRVRYVKPHGALYNTAAVDQRQAEAVVAAVAAYSSDLPLLGLAGSAMQEAAERSSVPFVAEAFADRAYTAAGQLVARTQAGAVRDDPAAVVAQACSIVLDGRVAGLDGSTVAVSAQSVCLHGDTPGATDLARQVRAALTAAGVAVRPFA